MATWFWWQITHLCFYVNMSIAFGAILKGTYFQYKKKKVWREQCKYSSFNVVTWNATYLSMILLIYTNYAFWRLCNGAYLSHLDRYQLRA